MSLATISQVRSHLYRLNLGEGRIRNQAVRMVAQEPSPLPHPRIVTGSETVKAAAGDIPVSEQLTLGSEPVLLTNRPPIPGTVVCAADDSLGVIYQENVDFAVDYLQGTVTRIVSGAIPANSEVTLWSLYYRTYQRGIDYTIDSCGPADSSAPIGSVYNLSGLLDNPNRVPPSVLLALPSLCDTIFRLGWSRLHSSS